MRRRHLPIQTIKGDVCNRLDELRLIFLIADRMPLTVERVEFAWGKAFLQSLCASEPDSTLDFLFEVLTAMINIFEISQTVRGLSVPRE